MLQEQLPSAHEKGQLVDTCPAPLVLGATMLGCDLYRLSEGTQVPPLQILLLFWPPYTTPSGASWDPPLE